MNPKEIRKDFPVLENRDVIYFDNAATSLTPKPIIKAVNKYYKRYSANIHRGVHKLSQKASKEYEKAHRKVANFFGKNSMKKVVFVRNTTEAINLVAHGLNFDEEDVILIDEMSHHSNMLPFRALTDAEIGYVKVKRNGKLDLEDLKKKLEKNPKLVALTHVSNTLGTIEPIEKISEMVHDSGAYLLVDGAQSAPHMPVNVEELGANFFAFSGHKMLGPTGIGGLIADEELLREMKPTYYGGDMIKTVSFESFELNELPWKFEAGTPAIAQGIGLGAAVDYLEKIGMEKIRKHEKELVSYALKEMEKIENVEIYGPLNPEIRGGAIVFNVKGLHCHDTAMVFDQKANIALRSGALCAEPIVTRYDKSGVTRASFYLYNTKEEVERFIELLEAVAKERKEVLFSQNSP